MNRKSLAYSNVQNQQQSSWNDDPFDFECAVKGMNPMDSKHNLSDYAQELVCQYGDYDGDQYHLPLSNLPDDEQNELVRLYMESTNRETSECVYGDDFTINSSYTCALLAMLKDDCKETRDAFAEVTRNNIILYYTQSLQHVLDYACYELLCNINYVNALQQQQDLNNGEIYWSKC